MNTPADLRIGTVGRPSPGVTIRIADDGEIQRAVDDTNKAVSKAEAIRKFTILTEDWTEEGGQMTPSLKLKRSVVMKQHAGDVEKLYAGDGRS